jgi:hypothetical protein
MAASGLTNSAAAVEVGEEHPAGAAGAGQADVQAADRAGTDHHHVVADPDPGEFLAVEHAGQRLGDGGLGEAQAVGHPVEAVDGEHLGGHDEVLGESAVVVVADRGLVGADGHPAAHAVRAGAARDRGDHLDPVTRPPFVHCGLGDQARDLVAHHARRDDVVVAVLEDLDVGATGRAVPDADLDLSRPRRGLGDVLEPQIAGRVEAGHFHV